VLTTRKHRQWRLVIQCWCDNDAVPPYLGCSRCGQAETTTVTALRPIQSSGQYTQTFALRAERFQNRCSTDVLTWPVVYLHPNTRYQTPLNRVTVHCHKGLSSHVKACRVIKCRH